MLRGGTAAGITCSHVIPFQTMKRMPKLRFPRLLDKPKYKERNIIERLFSRLKELRRFFEGAGTASS